MNHCHYTSAKHAIPHSAIVDMDNGLREKYDPKFRSVSNVHLGQRKLLLSEIQLLTEHYKHSKVHPTVLYIGAAPGSKNVVLAKLFPHVKFVLYDGAQFDSKLKHPMYKDTFEIHEGEDGFFTNEKCSLLAKSKRFIDRPLLFVSDIRLGEGDFEYGVSRDMQQQMEWVQMLKPSMSLLKFRFPYNMKHGDSLTYMHGVILFGIWAKEQSGETRLLVKKKDVNNLVKYDFKKYEETMFFHNKYCRPYCFVKEAAPFVTLINNNRYCTCYDCISELKVLHAYSKLSVAQFKDVESVADVVGPLRRPKKQIKYKLNLDAHLDQVLREVARGSRQKS